MVWTTLVTNNHAPMAPPEQIQFQNFGSHMNCYPPIQNDFTISFVHILNHPEMVVNPEDNFFNENWELIH